MRRFQFFVRGPLPGLNEHEEAARSHRMKAASLKKRWTNLVAQSVWIESKDRPPIFNSVTISLEWVEANRRRDPDNFCFAKKYILDGLVTAGVIANDGWGQVKGFVDTWRVGKKPGVLVTLIE